MIATIAIFFDTGSRDLGTKKTFHRNTKFGIVSSKYHCINITTDLTVVNIILKDIKTPLSAPSGVNDSLKRKFCVSHQQTHCERCRKIVNT